MKTMNRKSGQAMTEYVIIICVVAIAALLVAGVFGTNIRNLFKSANQSMVAGEATQKDMQDEGGTKDVRVNDFKD
ncbi:MAG: hypothetical protein KBC66_10300 [Kiritimatiellae bacterium]|jgi:Flp pilus assembly pilin Flp|nr:hypothetical protein [Kiritimatiellia bacterium]NLD89635.1 hypothetical protein [Lentisphaerota bacterium]HPC19161.1 hypothetical protein [Kiritimatiellia bacterium]HQQ60938.1 hypothetical protein [Kiritimatiellia bacterium]